MMCATQSRARETPLFVFHRRLGAEMTRMGNWWLPYWYPDGIVHPHLHTQALAGMIDKCHMPQLRCVVAMMGVVCCV